jgi:hypothetical protein
MNQLGEVWVPTEFHRDSFAASGVDARILHVVPEPVDVHNHFDPLRHRPLPLPLDQRVFGPDWPHISQDDDEDGGLYGGDESSPPFVFLSVFKWETRKVSRRAGVCWRWPNWLQIDCFICSLVMRCLAGSRAVN